MQRDFDMASNEEDHVHLLVNYPLPPRAKASGFRTEIQMTGAGNLSRASRAVSRASEKEIQSAILQYLQRCSQVAWARNMTVGRFRVSDRSGTRWMQAGFVGCSDILGQLTDGRLLAIEVKRHDGRATQDQLNFLRTVRAGRGVAMIARSVDDVIQGLANAHSVI